MKILDGCLREAVMQYGFMPRRGTVDAVFLLRKFAEKFIAKNKVFLYFLIWKRLLIGFQAKLFV